MVMASAAAGVVRTSGYGDFHRGTRGAAAVARVPLTALTTRWTPSMGATGRDRRSAP